MSEMVERVAKALRANSHFCTLAEDAGLGDAAFIRWSVEIARAAIAPMREPTEAMVKAGDLADGSRGRECPSLEPIYEAMIDAALDAE